MQRNPQATKGRPEEKTKTKVDAGADGGCQIWIDTELRPRHFGPEMEDNTDHQLASEKDSKRD